MKIKLLTTLASVFMAMQCMVSGATIVYWEFDNDATLLDTSVGGATYDLTQTGTSHAGNALSLASITNPDTSNGPNDPGATNAGSILGDPDEVGYLAGASGSRSALNLANQDWTFEGWLNVGASGAGSSPLDVVFTSRAGISLNGVLFDVRDSGTQSRFNLFVEGNPGETSDKDDFPAFNREEAIHFALTWDYVDANNGTFELFVNRQSQGTHDLNQTIANIDGGSHDRLFLLGRQNDADGSFNGYADEFRISDSVLTPDQFLNPVPEPGTSVLILFGSLLVWARRRMRSKS